MYEAASPESVSPLVSVIIATYNYSSVLKYAVKSVLWQTYQHFELWVIGDGCTDDSEAVVQSFGDPRIHWHNLPENSGSQSVPNNTGIKLAQGEYIAYLGHDDLWYPNHLEVLVKALEESRADAAHSLLMGIWPDSPNHTIYGISSTGQHETTLETPPSCVMHRRDMVEMTGYWRDYRTLRVPPDVYFLARASHLGKRFISVMELTVFKFGSAARKNVYRDKPSYEQATYADRIQHERDFLYHELLAAIRDSDVIRQAFEIKFSHTLSALLPGALIESWRVNRGLEPQPSLKAADLSDDTIQLLMLNNLLQDITPAASPQALATQRQLPKNGILLGAGWYDCEYNEHGDAFRWVNTAAEILLTELESGQWRLVMFVVPGPANSGQPVTIALSGRDGIVDEPILIREMTDVSFEIMIASSGSATYILRVFDSQNKPLPTDPRILNIAVSRLRLERIEDELPSSGG